MQVHASGVWEPFCQFELAIDPSRPPDPVEVSGPQSGGVGTSGECSTAQLSEQHLYALAPLDRRCQSGTGSAWAAVSPSSSSPHLLPGPRSQPQSCPLMPWPPLTGAAKAVQAVHGLRYRLASVDPTSCQPLPSNGKIVFKVRGG